MDATTHHPLGLRPAGNALLDSAHIVDARPAGLGALASLSDELLLCVLECLSARDLVRWQGASRTARAFGAHEDTWRTLVLRQWGGPGSWEFGGSWRATALRCARPHAPPPVTPRIAPFGSHHAAATGLYSDALFQAHYAATAAIDPLWLSGDSLRREPHTLSAAHFRARYDAPGTPVVLTGGACAWPGWRAEDGGAWGADAMRKAHGDVSFHAGGFDCSLRSYLDYAARETSDQPLYLFDAAFADKAPALGNYAPPHQFSEDLFSVLGAHARPDWRWLIMGPRKSGSVLHQDPNGTSAFNACLQGEKLWLLLPPDMTPPGVFASADGSHVCAPLSPIEWLLGFWEHYVTMRDARQHAIKCAAGGGGAGTKRTAQDSVAGGSESADSLPPLQAPVEGVVRAGDVVFIPRGWWHLVLNLAPINVAVTCNFCSREGLPHVLRFLKDKPDAISGVHAEGAAETLLSRFRAALAVAEPEELARADALVAAAEPPLPQRSKWARVMEGEGGEERGVRQAFSLASMWDVGGGSS